MTRFAAVVLVGLFAFLVPELACAQQGTRRVGIGVAIANGFESSSFGISNERTVPVFLVPIQVTNTFRIEPEIGTCRVRRQQGPFEESVKGIEVGLGVFPQMLQQNFRLYYGVRLGYTRIVREDPFFGDTRTLTLNGFFVAPAVGGEYLFSDRFSLGAEAQFRHTSVKGENVVPGLSFPDGSPASERIERSVSATRVLFISRFYF